MAGAAAAASLYMATLPASVIKVERARRGSRFETIGEEEESRRAVMSWDEECAAGVAASFALEAAPGSVITVTKAAFRSRLETIWEETMQLIAADAILRLSSSSSSPSSPVLGANHPNQIFVGSRSLEVAN